VYSGNGIILAEIFNERPDLLMQIGGYPFLLRTLVIEAQAQAVAGVVIIRTQKLCCEETALFRYGWVEALDEGLFEISLRPGLRLEFNMQNEHGPPHHFKLKTSTAVSPITLL